MTPIPLDMLRHHAAQTPDAPALTFEGITLSFRDLEAASDRVANALSASGVSIGDRVAIIARNEVTQFELYFGCAKVGAIMLPLNWRLSPLEIHAIVADAVPSLILVAAEFQPAVVGQGATPTIVLDTEYTIWRDGAAPRAKYHKVDRHDPVLILYTSGTTGVPKGVTISHHSMSFLVRMAKDLFCFSADSVHLLAMPLFHIGGIGCGMWALSQGGHTILLQQTIPEQVVESIRTYGVTHAFFVPAVIQMLVDLPGVDDMKLTSLQRLLYGASPISEALLKRAIAVFGCAFDHTYGMTETSGTAIWLPPSDHDPDGPLAHRLRSCGRALPWVELALVDPATGIAVATGEVGEIRIRSDTVMQGYWCKPDETAGTITSDGWLCTGDAAYQDADGYVYIHDRYKDMIVSGGENIYPTEIENVLSDHPGVAQVAVIGMPHDRWGETPKAFVVAKPDGAATESDLIAYTQSRLARYKCPTSVVFVSVLPRNASGKVLKKEMRNEAWLRTNT